MRVPACALLVLLATSSSGAALQTSPAPSSPASGEPLQLAVPGMPRDGQPRERTGTGRLAGRVVAADTGRPLRRALVRAMSPEMGEPRSVSTDEDGRWELKELPAGRYTVLISKAGYINLSYGQRRPFQAGTILELAEGQALDKLDVTLPRAGVITGTVVDEFGDPMSNVRVMAMRNRFAAGQLRLVGMGPGDTTDDIGQYRLHGLTPGEYYIAANVMGGLMFGSSDDRVGYAQTFYPGTPVQAHAQRVAVAEGQEVPQVNFSLAVTRVATISGRVVDSAGRPLSSGMLMLSSVGSAGMPTGFGIPIRPDGSFTYSNVPPGEYRLQAQHITPDRVGFVGDPREGERIGETASLALNVTGEDITGISLITAPAATAAGRVRFEGGKPAVAPGGLIVRATPLEVRGMPFGGGSRVRDDWTFELTGLTELRRIDINNPPPGWYLKRVTYDGHDITDSGLEFREGQRMEGIEILLTQRTTELGGSVLDAASRPVDDYVVVAFSSDPSRWGYMSRAVRAIRPNQDGRFSVKGLPPGEYLVVAVDYLEPGEEGDPEQLERWRPQASSVTLKEGQPTTVTLRLAP